MAYHEYTEVSDRHRALQAWGQQEEIWQEEVGHSGEAHTETIKNIGNLLSDDNTNFTLGSQRSILTANSPSLANVGAMEIPRGTSAAPQGRIGALNQWSRPDFFTAQGMRIFARKSRTETDQQQNWIHFLLFCSNAQPINTSYRMRGPAEGITSARIQITAPVKAVLMIFDRWQISDAEGAKILGFEGETDVVNLRNGLCGLHTRDNQDRARLVVDIFEGVFSLVQDTGVERGWIRVERPDLDGRNVLGLMTEGSMLSLLKAKGIVDYANGR